MSNIATKLSTLNVLRGAIGKAPLASWKNSEAELDQRIKDLTPGQNLVRPQATPDAATVLQEMEKAKADTTVTPTVLPPAPDVAKNAKRKAVVEQIAADSVKNDVPTTVIDAKAASRKINKAKKSAAPETTKTKAPAKAAKTSAPKSDNAFGALLKELGLDPKKARAKLRANDMSAPYTDLVVIRKVLTTDGRKKAK